MDGKQMANATILDDVNSTQVDVRSHSVGVGIYTLKGVAKKEYGGTGATVVVNQKYDISGAETIQLITGGAFPATTVTVKFYRGAYEDAATAEAVSVPLGTASEFAVTEVTVPNAGFNTHMNVSCTFTGGAYELFLGKKGLS